MAFGSLASTSAAETSWCRLRISVVVERRLIERPSLDASDMDNGEVWSSDPVMWSVNVCTME